MKTIKILVFTAVLHVIGFSITPLTANATTPLTTGENIETSIQRLNAYFNLLAKHNKFIGSVALYKNDKLFYQYSNTLWYGRISTTDKMLKYL